MRFGASMVFTNYVLQTAVVPLSIGGDPGILSLITMANPASLGWGLEMYGYGILGIAAAMILVLRASRAYVSP